MSKLTLKARPGQVVKQVPEQKVVKGNIPLRPNREKKIIAFLGAQMRPQCVLPLPINPIRNTLRGKLTIFFPAFGSKGVPLGNFFSATSF